MKLGFIDWVLIGSGIAIVVTFTIIEVTKYLKDKKEKKEEKQLTNKNQVIKEEDRDD